MFIRQSKFKHTYGIADKERFDDVLVNAKPTESNGVKGNDLFWAVAWGQGGGGYSFFSKTFNIIQNVIHWFWI
jgi:hypothetical protein